ncbi:radical SAM/SPASM domain-containing protein [Plebeiibacterium sediminum]|uniref:Radical SAM protein n=1 Tax=Plebeiibacterium sediminum TaxID=2992112 RepID=A0AAE3M2K9_9BACT|nr:radical SAM protein [Plebeiobacterium sediminum]MCW3785811.1 radical SAM protein [Plebeiobacterium sediminum]
MMRYKGFPMAVSIEPLNICNLSCPECPTGLKLIKRNKGSINPELYQKIIDQISKRTFLVNLYFQGEPLMHIKLFSLIAYAKQKGLVVSTSTNAQYITPFIAEKIVESGLDEIFISLDGITQDVYEKYRVGGDLNKVLDGIKNIVAAKQKFNSNLPIIRTQMLAFSFNEHQINSFKKESYKLGADIADVKTAQIFDVEYKKDLLPHSEDLTRYRTDNLNSIGLKGKIKNSCWKHWSSFVITWDGDVVPCCFDKDAHFKMGNVQNESLNHIWNNTQYNEFRKTILLQQNSFEMCNNCPLSRG